MITTEELIKQLSISHTPVKRDFSPLSRLFVFLYILPAFILIILYLIRPFSFQFHSLAHGIEVVSLFICLNLLTYLGLKAFTPGEDKEISAKLAFGSLLFIAMMAFFRIIEHQIFQNVRPHCELEAMGISLMTTFFCHSMLKKNEYARSNTLSSLFVLILPLISTVIFHGICSIKLSHVFSCHILGPLIIPGLYLLFFKRR